jgi:signal transduction histidine kinase
MTDDNVLIQEQAHDFIVRTTSDGIIIASPEGVIVQVNPAAAAMLGASGDQLIGKNPKHAFTTNASLINLFVRGGEQTLDVRLPRRRLAVGIATSLASGERLVVLHDVTEKRSFESRREALVKALTHDLRNPISAIAGFADLVSKFGDLNEQQNKFLTRIRQTAAKLQDVIGTLVDLAWIEAGMPLEHKPIQVRDIINEAVNKVTSLAHDRRIIIAVSVQNPLPTVMGDSNRLEFVIYSLLHNAILYSHPEQTVAIHAWGDTHEVYCSVADQGMGIADDELELVFDRMYRSRDDEVRNKPGGGLGLTLAKTIIERHGGDLWASSNLGEGSVFTFLLPTVEQN